MKFTEVEVIEHLVKAYKEAGKPTYPRMKIYIEDVIIVFQVLNEIIIQHMRLSNVSLNNLVNLKR